MGKGLKAELLVALAGTALFPGIAYGQVANPTPGQGVPIRAPQPVDPARADPETSKPVDTIVSDEDFAKAIPALSDDIDAPLESLDAFKLDPSLKPPVTPPADRPDAARPLTQQEQALEIRQKIENSFDAAPTEDPEFAAPLPSLNEFQIDTPRTARVQGGRALAIRYSTEIIGLKELDLEDRFKSLSALRGGDGRATNTAMVTARAREDEQLATRLLKSLGYYDATARAIIEQVPANSGNVTVTITAIPGRLYTFGSINIDAQATVPTGLIRSELNLNTGDAIDADRVLAAEANVSMRLPQQGYPFAELGQRDILLDDDEFIGDYSLPVDTGPRAVFGEIVTQGRHQVFGVDHLRLLRRYQLGSVYDVRKTDDLRDTLIATSLFSQVSVEPVRTGEEGPDGTEVVNLLVRQVAGKPRTIAGEAGYSTGRGLRVEGTWMHRNLFPPEGALIASGVAGTKEQGVSVTFRRSNAGLRDRTFQVAAMVNHSNFAAYRSYTGSLSVRMSRESTPLWQKRWTYFIGAELFASNEDRFNFNRGARDRGTWLIAAIPGFVGYDKSDDLLNPTKGFRIKANVSPETSVRGAARPYARMMLEGTYYQPIGDSIVIAGRTRVGTITGIGRDDLPPSRRYYAGGGGSVRGFGYQELGPRSPDGRPVGGRSFNEFAIEARYRFGNFGIVPFVDAGQVYEGIYPTGKNIRFGAGIGGRFYTNFGPLRLDIATPIARKQGESKIALYISIGQAF